MSLPGADWFIFFGGAVSIALAGSWHCTGMCGPIAGLASKKRPMVFYQSGRLAAYVLLGLLAAAFGKQILGQFPDQLKWIGALSIALVSLWILFSNWNLEFPRKIQKALWRYRPRTSETVDFLSLGFVTGLLPCHWLYGFVAVAAGLADPLKAALLMTSLWAGSVPWLLGASAITAFFRRFTARSPVLAKVMFILIVLGLVTHGFLHGDHVLADMSGALGTGKNVTCGPH